VTPPAAGWEELRKLHAGCATAWLELEAIAGGAKDLGLHSLVDELESALGHTKHAGAMIRELMPYVPRPMQRGSA
jgi:hypothetical protein